MPDPAIRAFDILAMPHALQWAVGGKACGQDVFLWMGFIRPPNITRPRQSDGMLIPRAAFGRGQIIPTRPFEDMRGLG